MILDIAIMVMCILGIALIIAGLWLLARRGKRPESEQAQAPTEAKVPGIGVEVSLPPPALVLVVGAALLVAGGWLAARAPSANGAPKASPTVSTAALLVPTFLWHRNLRC